VNSEDRKRKMVTMSDKADRATYEVEVGVPSQPIDRENSPMVDPIPMEFPSSKPRGLKVKNLVFSSPIATLKVKPRSLVIKSLTKHHVHVKDDIADTSFQEK
jgi:hypothetical protein